MSKLKGATLFTGGALCDIGMQAAGLDLAFGVEYDDAIAAVARRNGHNVLTEDVTTPGLAERLQAQYGPVDALHASPPCPNFSVAKTARKETALDLSLSEAVCSFLVVFKPRCFTLENVWGYRNSESWRQIRACLQREGYQWNAWHLDAADFGVPQNRKRMIVSAIRGDRPRRPKQTHAERVREPGLFGGSDILPWNGWHAAIADLLPGLPDSHLADWQKKRLPKEITESLLTLSGNMNGTDVRPLTPGSQPANTVRTSDRLSNIRAVLVSSQSIDGAAPALTDGGSPSVAVGTNARNMRALLLDTAQTGRAATLRAGEGSSPAVQAWHGRRPSHAPVAILMDGENGRMNGHGRDGDRRSITVTASKGSKGRMPRVVLIGAGTRSRAQPDDAPADTITSNHNQGNSLKGVLLTPLVRVVQLDIHCLARFQSVRDSYVWPESKTLACRVLGNGVPPLMATAIWESLLR